MKTPHTFLVLLLGGSLLFAGCGSGGGTDGAKATSLNDEQQRGKTLVSRSCQGCHSLNGKDGAGPTFQGLAGSTVETEAGKSLVADDAYLLRAILDPAADITKGYTGMMANSTPPGSVSEADAKAIVEYLKTLS